ncbi:MAG: hypothetical protein KGQ67_09755 [Betaproteobacteria bacterium]|nr:hypothetical protein [Betaproteobacteria bacterium]
MIRLSALRSTLVCLLAALGATPAAALIENVTTNRAIELRADKLPSASVISNLTAGAKLTVLSLEGGWALVEAGRQQGWVRAGALQMPAGTSGAAGMASGRSAPGGPAVALTIRSLGGPGSRHALLIAVGRYADQEGSALPGAAADRETALQIAQTMQVAARSTRVLADDQATIDAVRKAFFELAGRAREGDRVFIHLAAQGSQQADASGACAAGLLMHEGGRGGFLSHADLAQMLQPLLRRTDKLLLVIDAGGAAAGAPVAGWTNVNDEGALRSRHRAVGAPCPPGARPAALADELARGGPLSGETIILAPLAGDPALEDEAKGGLLTQFTRDCLLRDAREAATSGGADTVRQCVQAKLNARMNGDPVLRPPRIGLTGNPGAALMPPVRSGP